MRTSKRQQACTLLAAIAMASFLGHLETSANGQSLTNSIETASSRQNSWPGVQPDGRVTFGLNAPRAKNVRLRCDGFGEANVQQDGQGVWSFTSEPLKPDIYTYSFLVDGLRVLDPNNPSIKFNLFNSDNQLHVPGSKDLPWEYNDVPHGVLHRHHYRSAAIGEERDVWIYTPPGYDSTGRTRYPVLYLLHGYSDVEDTWITVGRANVILDNLIARGAAKPMVVVMPRGYGNRQIIASNTSAVRTAEGEQARRDSFAKFRESLFTEIMPLVEKSYRVSSSPAASGIAGLSMGGAQSLQFGLNAPDRFAWIGAFSSGRTAGASEYDAVFPGVNDKMSARVRLVWLACGTEDERLDNNRKFRDWLAARGVRHQWVELPGGHTFIVWRRCLAQFLPALFQH